MYKIIQQLSIDNDRILMIIDYFTRSDVYWLFVLFWYGPWILSWSLDELMIHSFWCLLIICVVLIWPLDTLLVPGWVDDSLVLMSIDYLCFVLIHPLDTLLVPGWVDDSQIVRPAPYLPRIHLLFNVVWVIHTYLHRGLYCAASRGTCRRITLLVHQPASKRTTIVPQSTHIYHCIYRTTHQT